MTPTLNGIARRAGAVLAGVALAAGVATGSAAAADKPTIRFGVPTWTGVTVKSEVAAQILEHMGYATKQTTASPAVALNTIKSDELDVYLGGWMPTEKEMIDPLVENNEAKVLTTNISDAIMGLAVPTYVWEAGVKTEADLAEHAGKFDKKIYGIEAGSGFNKNIKEAIDNDRHGLGDWQLISSSTSGMLAQTERAIQKDDWIVFLGWEPHWMNIRFDIKYLKAVGEPKIAETTSDVLTVANIKLGERHPDVETFFSQYVVRKDEQSKWVLQHGQQDMPAEEVASQWIAGNLDRVAEFLDGVKARDGQPAIEAVKAAVGS